MVGSAVIASWIAHGAFWILLALGTTELRRRTAAVFVALWLIGYVAFGRLGVGGFFVSYVAVLDIALVFIVYKGDVRLT